MDQQVLERRLEKLREGMETDGLSVAVLSRPQHLFYFTYSMPGPSPAFLLVTAARVLGVAPTPLGGCETITYPVYDINNGWDEVKSASEALLKAMKDCVSLGGVAGTETDHLPLAYLPVIQSLQNEIKDLKDILWQVRRVKDSVDLAQIESNIAGNDRVFTAVQEALCAGVEELAIWAVIQNTLCDSAGGPVILEGDLGVGVRGSNPDAKPGHEIIRVGDTVFVDVYSATHGYYADTTRVFSVGKADSRQRDIFAILREALFKGEKYLQAGTPANVVDAAVRGVIEKAGYGANFPHHSGHAYGLFQQEKPYLIPAEIMPLETGMILTLEPGIYIPGWGGMRLEGNYYIENTGARRLDHFPSEIIECEA